VSGIFDAIAAVDAQLAEQAAKDQRIAELERDVANLTAFNDKLQNQVAGLLCRIDELEADLVEQGRTVSELRRTVADLRGAR
jgi:uncharacterized coiled-coil protein SlyX